MQFSRFPHWLVYALLALSMGACAQQDIKMTTAKADYERAKNMVMEKKAYHRAAYFLQKYASEHPYSHYTIQAELLRAYAGYKGEEYPSVEFMCKQFIRRHPMNRDVDYAEYLLAMTYYHERSSPGRDQTMTKNAIKAFQRVINEHPGTDYAKDSARYLQHLYNNLAIHELTVGKFYYDHKQYVAAINRFQVVITDYQTTPSIEEALYYLAASYDALGLKHDAEQTSILLQANYPQGEWSEKAKAFR